jgi:putative transposase
MIETVQQGLKAEGHEVSIQKLCEWFGLPRRTFYYKSVKSAPKVQQCFERPIKAMIEEHPSFGYRTVAHLPTKRLAGAETPCGLPAPN